MMVKRIKKILLLCAAAVFPLFLLSVNVLARPFGDVTGDGAVTSDDARGILRAAVGLTAFSGETRAAADLDGDGSLTSGDARLALRTAVGLEAVRSVEAEGKLRADVSSVGVLKNGVYTYNALKADLSLLFSAMPSRFSYRSLGKTADGRDIFCAVLGTGHGSTQIVSDVGIHGCEHMNPPAVMRALAYYLQNYDNAVYKGKTMRQILADTDIYVIPMLNPDGVTISQSGLSGLKNANIAEQVRGIYNQNRKAGNTKYSLAYYLKIWKANANGVDLNRNFHLSDPRLNPSYQVKAPANGNYAGNRLKPEAETAAYINLVESLPHPVAAISIHSQGGVIYWYCRQNAAVKAAAKQLAGVVSGATGYWIDNSDHLVNAAPVWAMHEKGILGLTIECGRGTTPLPSSQVPIIYAALKNVFPAVAELYH